jgi:hypothetical protein
MYQARKGHIFEYFEENGGESSRNRAYLSEKNTGRDLVLGHWTNTKLSGIPASDNAVNMNLVDFYQLILESDYL